MAKGTQAAQCKALVPPGSTACGAAVLTVNGGNLVVGGEVLARSSCPPYTQGSRLLRGQQRHVARAARQS